MYQTYICQLIAYFSYCVQHPIRSLKRSFYILNCLYAYLNDDFTFYESICFNNGRIAVFGECMKERTLYKLRLRFYFLVLCVYTFLLIWITKQRNGLLTTLLIVILLKRLFYNTRFILFSNGCKYVVMPLTKLTQHGNDDLLTTTYILS
jgi:hypothetical protein